MARSISVKVPVATLISSIENKIAEIDKAIEDYPETRKQYEADLEVYKDKVAQAVSQFLKTNATKIGYNYDDVVRINSGYSGRLELTFDQDALDFPKRPSEPERPNQSRWYGRDHANQKDLLEKNLKILRMTTQEEVNASTYGAVMELL